MRHSTTRTMTISVDKTYADEKHKNRRRETRHLCWKRAHHEHMIYIVTNIFASMKCSSSIRPEYMRTKNTKDAHGRTKEWEENYASQEHALMKRKCYYSSPCCSARDRMAVVPVTISISTTTCPVSRLHRQVQQSS